MAGRDVTRDHLDLGACSYRSRLAPRNKWLWGTEGFSVTPFHKQHALRERAKGSHDPPNSRQESQLLAYDHENQIDKCLLGFDTKTRRVFKVIPVLPFQPHFHIVLGLLPITSTINMLFVVIVSI